MKRLALRLLKPETAIIALTMTALICLPIALRMLAPDAASTLLLPASLIGAAGGLALFRSRLRKKDAAVFYVAGTAALFIRVGHLGSEFADAARASLRLMLALLLPMQVGNQTFEQLAGWLSSIAKLGADVAVFGQRGGIWLVGLLRGAPADDPAARAFFLALGVWILAGWAAWRLRTKDDTLGALLPTTVLLAVTLNLTVQNRWPLWVHLGSLMLLLTGTNLARLLRSWKAKRTDYSDSIPEDSLLSAVLVIVLLLASAFTVSSVSVKDLLDRLRERQQPSPSSVARSSSSQGARSYIASGGQAVIENTHLITAGPKLSPDVIMYISTGDLPPVPGDVHVHVPYYYWRGTTYETYSGHGWFNPTRADIVIAGETRLLGTKPGAYRPHHAVVHLAGGGASLAYWSGNLVASDAPLEVAWRSQQADVAKGPFAEVPRDADVIGALIAPGEDARPQSYAVDSLISTASEADLRAAPATYPAWVTERYLQLPEELPERVRALARDITAHGLTPYDRALAIETYLRSLPYSLEVPAPPSDRDATDYFVFDLKKGYCDYYATAMTILARSAGLPARLVTGYASGSYDPVSAQYVVEQADAHAWTEIYFTGIGWIEFEPTAGQPRPGRETAPSPGASAGGSRPTDQRWTVLPEIDASRFKVLLWTVPLLACLWTAWLLVDLWRLNHTEPAEATQRMYRRMHRTTAAITGRALASETANEHARALAETLSVMGARYGMIERQLARLSRAVTELTDLYMRSLFAPAPLGAHERRKAIALWWEAGWKISALRFFLAITRSETPRQSAPSSPPGSPAP